MSGTFLAAYVRCRRCYFAESARGLTRVRSSRGCTGLHCNGYR